MRWVVKLADGPKPEKHGLYLPRADHEMAFRIKLPVTISFAAMFPTKKAAEAAVEAARSRGFPADHPVYEKTYPRSFAPGTRP